MSEISPVYTTPAPALLTTAQLATLADTLAGERQSCADEPATPLGFWPTAVAALLSHVEALRHVLSAYKLLQAGHELDYAALAKVGQWQRDEAASELEYTRQMGRETEKAMTTLARRVLEMQAELAEQEKDKLLMVLDNKAANKRLTEALESLGDMYDQYTPGKFGHDFMSAGEGAQDVLGNEGLLDDEFNFKGIPPQPAA